MGRIVEEVRSLPRDIGELRNSRDNVKSKKIMPAEPLNTVEQFMELENLLQKDEENAKFKSEVMQNIKYTGAKFIRTAWRSLVSDESMAIRDVFLHEVKGNDTEYISGIKTIFQFAKT
uniref:Uncharacterized protein n=1 Tax=Bactrocera latifrons TaxID=174628 RepID=A0A0K8VY41_BACLA